MVGRSSELGVLRRLCHAAAAGAGGSAVVEGLAGVGKTTVLRALVEQVGGLQVLWGRVPEEGGAPAYWAWREVAAAGGWDVTWDATPDPWSLWAQVAAEAVGAARAQPLLLLLDDLHAADDDTVRMTAYLARVLQDAPVALVVGTRPDDRVGSLARTATSVPLGPLDSKAADELVDQHAPPSLPHEVRRSILDVAEGNPLVLRELARAAGQGSGAWPREVRAAVESRLAPLPADTRELLELASVLGRRFDVSTLARLARRPELKLLEVLEPVRRLGILEGAGPTWSFSHQVLRDVVHDGLPETRRLAAHKHAAAVLTSPALVAHHLVEAVPAVPREAAVQASRLAAREAAASSAHGERTAVLQRALPLTEGGARLEVLLELGAAQLDAGAVAAAHESFEEATRLAWARGDEAAWAEALLGLTERVETSELAIRHLASLRVAAQQAEASDDRPRLVRLRTRHASLSAMNHDTVSVLPEAQSVTALARELGDPRLLATALTALHVCCWAPGRQVLASSVSAELAVVARESGDPDLVLEAEMARMVDALRRGDLVTFDDALAGAGAVADRTGSPRHHYFALSRRATRMLLSGRLAEGAQLAHRAYEVGLQIEEPDARQVLWGSQFLVLAELNGVDELHEMADAVLEFVSYDGRLVLVEANLRAAAGDVDAAAEQVRAHLRSGVPPTADADLAFEVLMALVAIASGDPSLAAAVEQRLAPHCGQMVVNAGAVTFCGMVDHWVGRLRQVQGKTAEARPLLEAALAAYVAMGAHWFVAETRRALEGPAPAGSRPGREGVLRRVDGGWEAGWSGSTTVVPDARGLHHLHAMLRCAGAEVHAADLVTPGSSALVTPAAREALLDDTAKSAYRSRIRDLQNQIAADAGDVERTAAAQHELDALLDELRRAVGLGGRDRRPTDDAERARVAVRKAVAAALTRLAEKDATFAAHLRASVRTGLHCAYASDPTAPVSWLLSG